MINQNEAIQTLIAAGMRVVQNDTETSYKAKASIVYAIQKIEDDLKKVNNKQNQDDANS
mgnify:CR=1 FL=1